jgi:hypothetical protein
LEQLANNSKDGERSKQLRESLKDSLNINSRQARGLKNISRGMMLPDEKSEEETNMRVNYDISFAKDQAQSRIKQADFDLLADEASDSD